MKRFVLLTAALVVAAATAAATGVVMVGGAGTANNTIPFWGGRTDPGARWQTLWLQSELGLSGPVIKIEWQVSPEYPGHGGKFNDCKMYLCHTKLAAVTATFKDNYGGNTPVQVYSGTFVIPPLKTNEWHTIVAPTNFKYNNSDNLLMEATWVGPSTGGTTPFRTSKSGPGRVYAWDPNAATGRVGVPYAYYARITISYTGVAPTSLGRVKALYQ